MKDFLKALLKIVVSLGIVAAFSFVIGTSFGFGVVTIVILVRALIL